MKNKNEIKIKYLVLWLADSCNLNCKYCYAHPNFTNKFMNFEIAKKAIVLGTGARGLRSILEKKLLNLMYRVPDEKDIVKIIIDGDTIAKDLEPEVIKENDEKEKAGSKITKKAERKTTTKQSE